MHIHRPINSMVAHGTQSKYENQCKNEKWQKKERNTKDLLHYLATKEKQKFRYDNAEVRHRNPDRPNMIHLILPWSRSEPAQPRQDLTKEKKKFRYDNAEVQLVQRPLDDLEIMNKRIRPKHKIICTRLQHVRTPLEMIWQLPFDNWNDQRANFKTAKITCAKTRGSANIKSLEIKP